MHTQHTLLRTNSGVRRPPILFHRPPHRKGKENVYQETRIKLSVKLSIEFSSNFFSQSKRENSMGCTSQCLMEKHTPGFQETHFRRNLSGGWISN